jgi:hypothetical protein
MILVDVSYINNAGLDAATSFADWEELQLNEIKVFEITPAIALPSNPTRPMTFEYHPRD